MHCPKCGEENLDDSMYCAACGEKIEPVEKENRKVKARVKIRFWPLLVSVIIIFAVIRCLPADCLGSLCTKRELFQIARNGAGGLLCSILIFAALFQFVLIFFCAVIALVASIFENEDNQKALMEAGIVITASTILWLAC